MEETREQRLTRLDNIVARHNSARGPVTQYKVARSYHEDVDEAIASLTKEVNDAIKEWWHPLGGIHVIALPNGSYLACQAIGYKG